MERKGNVLIKAAGMVLVMTLICGVLYTAAMTGISQLLFKDKANGSMIVVDGQEYGSEFLGQKFSDEKHMWGRIMNVSRFTDQNGESKAYGGPSNLSPNSEAYKELLAERISMIKEANPKAEVDKIPVDLVTCSGSGLDPDISIAAAMYQVPRLAEANNMSQEKVKAIIDKCTRSKILGIFGEETVNVLKVNLMLEGR